jgi:hypothetical protein
VGSAPGNHWKHFVLGKKGAYNESLDERLDDWKLSIFPFNIGAFNHGFPSWVCRQVAWYEPPSHWIAG